MGAAAQGTAGTIVATNDIISFHSSDKRLKKNFNKIKDPIEKLKRISGYMFEWIENGEIHPYTGKDIGVIAQEINSIIPEITTLRNNGYLAVKYEKIVPLLIECIKENTNDIDELKKKIKELYNKIDV